MGLWQRRCPEGLEIRPCEDAKGNGLFTTKALNEAGSFSCCFFPLPGNKDDIPLLGPVVLLLERQSLTQGQQLFEEDPVCGMALLMFDQTNIAQHCQHCMRYLEGISIPLIWWV